jgi:hypothetical protein
MFSEVAGRKFWIDNFCIVREEILIQKEIAFL